MADERNISPNQGAQSVAVTVAAVRRVAALAERALRDEGYTEADPVLQDLLAAKLVAEDALVMEQEGDPLAALMAREALRMAEETFKAINPQVAQAAPSASAAPAASAPVVPTSVPTAASAPAVAPTAPAVAPAHVVPAAAPAAATLTNLPEVFASPPKPAPVSAPASASAPTPKPAPKSASKPRPPKTKRPKAAKRVCAALAVALVAMAGAVGAAWWGLIDLPEPVQHRIELLPDAHAQKGYLSAPAVELDPGAYQLVLNQDIVMDAGSRTLPVAFENPEANANSSRLELSLDGERVAATGMVEPGHYVEDVQLSRTLPQGEHELAATVYVYSGATQINTMSANVTVRVK